MISLRTVGILLVAAGILAVVFGRFSYTEETHDVDIGPLEVEVKERETVNIPLWVGVVAVAAGAALIVMDRKRRLSA